MNESERERGEHGPQVDSHAEFTQKRERERARDQRRAILAANNMCLYCFYGS